LKLCLPICFIDFSVFKFKNILNFFRAAAAAAERQNHLNNHHQRRIESQQGKPESINLIEIIDCNHQRRNESQQGKLEYNLKLNYD
jgi:hypothetical protein